jgi:DNA-binding NtrC family response regulator
VHHAEAPEAAGGENMAVQSMEGGSAHDEREHVLVVDDETTVREFLTECLGLIGFSSIAVPDGFQAVEAYSKQKTDISLVISDVAMPGMNGVELARRLKEIDPGVKVILSSGYDTDHIKDDIPSSVVDFIQKPYKVAELSAAIEKALVTVS